MALVVLRMRVDAVLGSMHMKLPKTVQKPFVSLKKTLEAARLRLRQVEGVFNCLMRRFAFVVAQ
eukprot:1267113-Alexandrium_andersonii.AAC.1